MSSFVKGSITITFRLTILPLSNEYQRFQNVGISGDGTVRIYDRETEEQFVRILFKDIHSNLSAIRSFIRTTVKMRRETFIFTPDANVNVGNGDGGAIIVRYWNSNFIENQVNYQKYNYEMILRKEVS